MKIDWQISSADVGKVKKLLEKYRSHPVVKRRKKRNLASEKPLISKQQFWQAMVGCLLTTQQRSGAGSHVERYMRQRPFPLAYRTCRTQYNLATFARKSLSGLRFSTKISKEIEANYCFLNSGGWKQLFKHLNRLRHTPNHSDEKAAAEFIDDHFKGFGPKQSRNLLQWIGLTRYEIPLDSRVTKWLNRFRFPVKLSAGALQDYNYYNFVSDGVQRLCEASDVYPCMLDAAIFASFERNS